MNPRTHVILDGLQDPMHGRELSVRWMAAGFENAVDVAGQTGWIAKADVKDAATQRSIGEEDLVLVAGIARAFGVEIRERVGSEFKPDNDLPALRGQMTREYRARFSQALVFGLPALVVHYLGPMLSSGGGQTAGSMAFPWLIELVLVGWALWVAGLPILWQGVWSAIHLRATADLLTTAIVFLAFVPSAYGVISLLFTEVPWFGSPVEVDAASHALRGPAFHIAMAAVMIATCQRWRMHHHVAHLSGRAYRMMPHSGRLMALWTLAMIATMTVAGWQVGLTLGLLLPPLISSGGINRTSPGWSAALPIMAFAPFFLFGPRSIPALASAHSLRFEIAFCFAWMMTLLMSRSWSRMPQLSGASAPT